MPSLIGAPLGGGVSGTIDANYRQQQVPFSRFGTRKIVWYAIRHADTNSGGVIDMVKLNTMIDTIQTRMEVAIIGAPHISNNWGKFMIGVYEDTANDGPNIDLADTPQLTNSKATTLQEALQAATGDNVLVEEFYLAGAPESGNTDYIGFSTLNEYKEYTYKGDYDANSYVFNGE
jgi:hypothetical protein